MTSLSCHSFPGLEEEEEEQLSLEQTATSAAAGEEEEGELGEGTVPTDHQQVLHRQKREEVRESNRASWRGLYCIPLQSNSLLLLSPLLPSPLTTSNY